MTATASVPSWRTPPPVGDYPQLLHGAATEYEIQVVSEDILGVLTFTVTIGGTALGPFQRSAAQQVSGAPVNHVAPVLAATSNPGVYGCTPGLWTFGLPAAPVPTYQWRRNGTAIPGATGATYAQAAADAGTSLRCEVTVGGVVAASNQIALPAAASMTVTFLGTRNRTGAGAFEVFNNPSPAPGQRLVVFISGEPYGSPNQFQMTVNGGTTIAPLSALSNIADNAMSVFEVAAPTGAAITIASLGSGGAMGSNYCAVYLITGGQRRQAGAASAIGRAAGTVSVTVDVAAGGAVIAASAATWYNGATLNDFTGVNQNGVVAIGSGEQIQLGSAVGLAAAAAYAVGATITPAGQQVVLAAVSMEPV